MYQILERNQIVYTESSSLECRVEDYLGGGGQGEVYRAKLAGKHYAIKWYLPHTATVDQRKNLEVLIETGPPNEKFLWPIDLVFSQEIPDYGYLMLLRDSRFFSLMDLMKRRAEPTFWALTTAGFGLADSFLKLHSKGFCYRDISFGNVFFNPKNGDILICDNDNVSIDDYSLSAVSGTPRFMAPEIVRGEAKPSTDTDLFSLAVLLFYMLMMHHPLQGKKELEIHCLDLLAMRKIYGDEPIFIFDPENDSNRPQEGYHDNALDFWPIYPSFIRDLFIRSFTVGISDPKNGRVRESEWRASLSRLRDLLIFCDNCGFENFYDINMLLESENMSSICWKCKSQLKLPPRLKIDGDVLMMNFNTKLYPHHVDKHRLYDFSSPIAVISQHPKKPNVWGLKNLSNEKWVITKVNNEMIDILPGRSVTITDKLEINFGQSIGRIRAG